MSIIRIGSNDKYASGWETAFGKSKKKAGAGAAKKSAAAKKATAKSAKKKSAKKKA